MTVLRLVIFENSKEFETFAPHTGEFKNLNDAKRCADRHQKFLSTDLIIETEAGDVLAYRHGILPWEDYVASADFRLMASPDEGDIPLILNTRCQTHYARRKRAAGFTRHTFWLKKNELSKVRQLLTELREEKS